MWKWLVGLALTLLVQVQLPLGWNTYLLFNTDIVNFAWKINEGENRKYRFVNFYFLVVLEFLMDEGWQGGAKSLI